MKYRATKNATFFGASGVKYTVKRGQVFSSVEGEIPAQYVEVVDEERQVVEVSGEKVETAAKKPKAEKRSK